MTRAFGRVLSVREREAGALLAEDAAASATTLVLDDITQFAEIVTAAQIRDDDGNTEDIVITAYDADEDTVTLETGLASSWTTGDVVAIVPAIITRIAHVAVDGAEDDAVEVLVPSQVAHLLKVGSRLDDEQERITVEFEEETGSWIVTHVWVTNVEETVAETGTKTLHYRLDAACDLPFCGDVLSGITAQLVDVRATFAGAPTGGISVDLNLNGAPLQLLSFEGGAQGTETYPLAVYIAAPDELEVCFTDNADAELPFDLYVTADFG